MLIFQQNFYYQNIFIHSILLDLSTNKDDLSYQNGLKKLEALSLYDLSEFVEITDESALSYYYYPLYFSKTYCAVKGFEIWH
jgi:hypothetical protein